MMSIRRKALSICSSALANNQVRNTLGKGSTATVNSKPLRDVSSFKTDFLTPKWIRSSSSLNGPADVSESLAQIQMSEVRRHSKPAYFSASGAVLGSGLTVNSPQALGMGSSVSTTLVPNVALFWHINNGIEEIIADYVHHEMTRSLVLVMMRLFLIVAAKDVFVATN